MTEERVKSFQFRQELARMIANATTRPVVVTKKSEPEAVLISYQEFMRLRKFMYTNAVGASDKG